MCVLELGLGQGWVFSLDGEGCGKELGKDRNVYLYSATYCSMHDMS